jgi:hypothetical protein
VYPAAGALDKAKGRMLEKPFGPATSWHLTFSASGATVIVTTAQGSYEVRCCCCCCCWRSASSWGGVHVCFAFLLSQPADDVQHPAGTLRIIGAVPVVE